MLVGDYVSQVADISQVAEVKAEESSNLDEEIINNYVGVEEK